MAKVTRYTKSVNLEGLGFPAAVTRLEELLAEVPEDSRNRSTVRLEEVDGYILCYLSFQRDETAEEIALRKAEEEEWLRKRGGSLEVIEMNQLRNLIKKYGVPKDE